MLKTRFAALALAGALVTSGCAVLDEDDKYIASGTAVGAAGGTAIGAAIGHTWEGALYGAISGAALGFLYQEYWKEELDLEN